MKVIAMDNFGNEMVSDKLIADCLTKQAAEEMAKEANDHTSAYGPWYYRAVPDDYKLYKFEPLTPHFLLDRNQ